MSEQFDPVANLLQVDEARERSVRELGEAMMNFETAVSEYREAYKTATGAGWTKRDLNAAGFFDSAKLPRVKKITPAPVNSFDSQGE